MRKAEEERVESLLRAKHFPRIHPQFLQRVNIRLFESRKGDVDHVPRVSHSAMSTRLQYSLSLSTIRRRASQSANRLPLNRAIYGSRDRKRGSFRGGYLCILAQLNSIKPGFLPPPAR